MSPHPGTSSTGIWPRGAGPGSCCAAERRGRRNRAPEITTASAPFLAEATRHTCIGVSSAVRLSGFAGFPTGSIFSRHRPVRVSASCYTAGNREIVAADRTGGRSRGGPGHPFRNRSPLRHVGRERVRTMGTHPGCIKWLRRGVRQADGGRRIPRLRRPPGPSDGPSSVSPRSATSSRPSGPRLTSST